MTSLAFEITGAHPEPHAAAPTIIFRLRVTEVDGGEVHAVALRSQIRIEPQKRPYDAGEEVRLYELFGDTPRWGDSLRPFVWTHVSTTLGPFQGVTEVDPPVGVQLRLRGRGVQILSGAGRRRGAAHLPILRHGVQPRDRLRVHGRTGGGGIETPLTAFPWRSGDR